MKICKKGKYIYLINNQGELWHFHSSLPSKRISMGYIFCGEEETERIKNSGVEVSEKMLKGLRDYLESNGYGKDDNYDNMCKLLGEELSLSQEQLDKVFDYDKDAVDLFNTLNNSSIIDKSSVYRDCCEYLKKWNGDKVRAKKFIEKFCISGWDGTLVDVFPSKEDLERPTYKSEHWLLRKFHHNWGDNLDKYISEAVEKYPSFDDIDYAAYYVQDCIAKERYEELKELEKKYGKQKKKS